MLSRPDGSPDLSMIPINRMLDTSLAWCGLSYRRFQLVLRLSFGYAAALAPVGTDWPCFFCFKSAYLALT